MNENSNIFINKKILIYGLGKSGISSFEFLKKKNQTFLFDDDNSIKLIKNHKANLINICEACHDRIHSEGSELKIYKTTNGYEIM